MNKRLWTLPVLVAVLLAVASGVGFAIPSLSGPTGIVSVPTAVTAPPNTLQAALSYQAIKMQEVQAASMYSASETSGMYAPVTSTRRDLAVWSLQALAGVTDKAELWLAYSTVRDTEDSHIWGIGGKVALTKEPEEPAALAVGASYKRWTDGLQVAVTSMYGGPVTIETTDVKVLQAYIVATKDFTPMKGEKWEWGPGGGTRMLGSLGLMYERVDPGVGDSQNFTRPFIGFEFMGAGGTSLGLEYRWRDNDLDEKAIFSAVLRHRFSSVLTAEVGTTNASPIGTGLNDEDIFVRVGYSFPMKGY